MWETRLPPGSAGNERIVALLAQISFRYHGHGTPEHCCTTIVVVGICLGRWLHLGVHNVGRKQPQGAP